VTPSPTQYDFAFSQLTRSQTRARTHAQTDTEDPTNIHRVPKLATPLASNTLNSV